MIRVNTLFKGGKQFENQSRGHLIPCDQPAEAGGQDQGPTPPELFLASIGSCAGVYATGYCQARGIDPSGIEVVVEGEKVSNPTRIGAIEIRVTVPPSLSEKDRLGIERAVNSCLIKNTLAHPPEIRTTFEELVLSPEA